MVEDTPSDILAAASFQILSSTEAAQVVVVLMKEICKSLCMKLLCVMLMGNYIPKID